MKKHNRKDKKLNESGLKKVYEFHIYPRVTMITTDGRFVNCDNGSLGGTH